MSKSEKRLSSLLRVMFVAMSLPYIFTVLTWIMPEGFVLLVPFIALGVWSQWGSVQNWVTARKFRKELNRGLPSVPDRDRL